MRRVGAGILIVMISLLSLSACGGVGGRPSSPARGGKDAAYYYLMAEMEGRRNEPAKAIGYLDRALEMEPLQARFWYKRSFFYAASGNLKKAEEDIGKAVELSADDQDILVLQGKILQSLDRKKEAIAAYRKALRLAPSLEEANILLIEASVAELDNRSALQATAAWEKNDPVNVTPMFYEAWVLQNFSKDIPRAIGAYERVLTIEPGNMKALQALAEIYVGRKDEGKILGVLRRMETAQPNDAMLKLKLALIYYEQKNYEEAIGKFQELLKTHPEDDRILYYLGVIYENLKRDAEAETEFSKIKADSSFFKDARLHLAYLKVRDGKRHEAINILEDSIELKPDVAPLYEYLSEIYRDEGDLPQAIDTLKTGLKRCADKEVLYYALGTVYDRAGQFDESMKAMREVLKLNPQNSGAMNYIGYSYADRGINLEEALELLQKALSLKPGDGYITDSLGWAYFQKGDLDQAVLHVQKAYTMTQGEPTITEHLADIWLKKGDKTKALKYYREAIANLEKKRGAREDKDSTKKALDRLSTKITEVKP